jgi:hypothetical protein
LKKCDISGYTSREFLKRRLLRLLAEDDEEGDEEEA